MLKLKITALALLASVLLIALPAGGAIAMPAAPHLPAADLGEQGLGLIRYCPVRCGPWRRSGPPCFNPKMPVQRKRRCCRLCPPRRCKTQTRCFRR